MSHLAPTPSPRTVRLAALAILAALALALPALAATLMPLPNESNTYTGNTRGYWFTAPSCFTITSLNVPTSAGSGLQNVQIVKLAAIPPSYDANTNDFVSLGLWRDYPSDQPIEANILVYAGDIIGILGSRDTTNSYGEADFVSEIKGQPVTLTRLGMQYTLATTDAKELWSEAGGSIGRVELAYDSGCFSSGAPADGTYGTPYSHIFTVIDLGEATFTVSAGSLPPGLALDPTSGELSGTPTEAGTFDFTVTATGSSGTGSQEVSLVVAKAPLSVTAADSAREYGAANPVFDGVLTGVLEGDNITATYTTTATAASAVGTYPIVPALDDPGDKLGNYQLTSTDGVLTVTPAPLAVEADNKTMVVGGTLPALTFSATGFRNDDDAAVITGALETEVTAASPTGAYPITIGTLSAPNYTINFTAGTLMVGDAVVAITSAELVGGMPLVRGVASPGREVTVTMDVTGPSGTTQMVYKVAADEDGDWSVDTATATPVSGALPTGGMQSGMSVAISASVVGAPSPATRTLDVMWLVYIPLLPGSGAE